MTRTSRRVSFGLAVGVFALVVGHGVDAAAAAESMRAPVAADRACVLYVNVAAGEDAAAWAQLGYTLVERPDLATMPIERRARLLDDTHLGLVRGTTFRTDHMWLSTTNGIYTPGWVPVTFAAPRAKAKIDGRYACATLRARLPFYRESRRAIADVFALSNDRPIGRTRGEAILDIERAFLVQKGLIKYERTNARATYLKLVADVKAMAATSTDTFALWWRVRELIFGDATLNVDYCRDEATMTAALVDRCTNCVGESYLLFALFLDAGVELPKGWQLGGQLFSDHLRAVLYNPTKKITMDLASGDVGPFQAAIFDVDSLYRAAWRGHSSLRFADESRWIEAQRPRYAFLNTWCAIPRLMLTGERQAAKFTGFAACDRFLDGDPPERADNANKARHARGTESLPHGAPGAKTEGYLDKLIGAFTSLLPAKPPVSLNAFDSETAAKLDRLAQDLIPAEADIVRRATRRGYADAETYSVISDGAIVRGLGFAHLLNRPFGGDVMIQPVLIEYRPKLNPADFRYNTAISIAKASDTYVWNCEGSNGACVTSSNQAFVQRLKSLPNAERIRVLTEVLADSAAKAQGELLATVERLSTVDASFDRLTDPRVAKQLAELNDAVRRLTDFVTTFPSFTALAEDHPLRTSLQKLIDHRVDLNPSARRILDVAEQLVNEPVAVVKYLDTHPTPLTNEASAIRVLGTVDSLMSSFRRIPALETTFAKWAKSGVESASLVSRLVIAIFTHPAYFFTVEPDADEILAARPFYPLALSSDRVRDVRIAAPRGGAPVIAGGLEVTVQWEGLATGSSDRNDGRDAADRTGVTGGSPAGRADDRRPGDDARRSNGTLRGETRGKDAAGRLRLNQDLNKEYARHQPLAHLDEIRAGTEAPGDAGDVSAVDQRPEVRLSPEFWFNLITLAQYDLFREPTVELLFHHAYRRRIGRSLRADPELSRHLILNFTDVAPPALEAKPEDWPNAAQTPKLITALPLTIEDSSEGLSGEAFFRAALREADHPKSGWLRTTNTTAVDAEADAVDQKLAKYVASKGVPNGLIIPAFQRRNDRIELTLNASSVYYTFGKSKALTSEEFANLGGGIMHEIYGTNKNDLRAVTSPRGHMFDRRRSSAHLIDQPLTTRGDPSPTAVRDLIIESLRIYN